MSLTVQQVVTDAKNLALKLKERNNTADNLLSQGHTVHKQIDIMKQYADDVAELNETARHRPHSVLVAGIQQENRHLRDLQQENKELKAALEEQQNALELIMSKYRQQVSKLVQGSKIDLPRLYNQRYTETILDQALKISEMAAVMKKAASVDEDDIIKHDEELQKLTTENQGLRKLLGIATMSGSLSSVDRETTENAPH